MSDTATCEQGKIRGESFCLVLLRHDPTDSKITEQYCYKYKCKEYKTPNGIG